MGHQNVKHAACAALRFGQERPQCDQSALRRFVGDGGAAVGPLKGSARAIATGRQECRDRQVAKEISQLQVGRRIQSVGTRIWGPDQGWLFRNAGVRYPTLTL